MLRSLLMKNCPFCKKEFYMPEKKEVEVLGELLSKNDNNELSLIYPHVFNYCPQCGMIDGDFNSEQISIIEENADSLSEILEQELDLIDENKFARVAECRGYVCELLDDVAGATLAYKAGLDIIESQIRNFEEKHLKHVQNHDEETGVLVDADLDQYANAKIYCDTLRRLVASTSAKSFEKLGYLGILIHLDTIIKFQDFRVPDQMFALLNDKTTIIPEVLKSAKNQIEDNYLKIRKRNNK